MKSKEINTPIIPNPNLYAGKIKNQHDNRKILTIINWLYFFSFITIIFLFLEIIIVDIIIRIKKNGNNFIVINLKWLLIQTFIQ